MTEKPKAFNYANYEKAIGDLVDITKKYGDLKAEYDKLKEKAEMYRWHDLRKDPEDLPENNEFVLVAVRYATDKGNEEPCYFVGECYDGYWETCMHHDCMDVDDGDKVIAWRYIEPLEEVEMAKKPETCRERLMREHPGLVSTTYVGGCKNCPSYYHYADDPVYCQDGFEETCRMCWDRPVTSDNEQNER